MRVLIADNLPDAARTRLAASGFLVHADAGLRDDTLTEALATHQPDVLIVRSTKVTAAHVAACPSLSLVVRGGAGVNTIDLAACSAAGVFVANCPGKNAVAVAELAFGLLLAVDRHLAVGDAELKAGRWNKGRFAKAEGLAGRTLGLLGTGSIGQAMIPRARAFGMEVVAWSRSLDEAGAAALGIRRLDGPEAVARAADVLSVHLALTPETRGLVGDAVLQALPHGAILLNTSRAEVVDGDALLRALDTRGLRAGLDVFPDEPGGKEAPFASAIAAHPQVVGSHHIGASTEQAQRAVADEACRIVEAFRDEGRVHNCVNRLIRSAATHRLVVRHRDQVGALAGVLRAVSEAGLNVQEMENLIFPGGAAIARIQVAGAPPEGFAAGMADLPHVIHASLVDIQEAP